jgi:hypothetical protein
MKKKSIYGLKPSQLGRLLSVSACVPESVSDMTEDQIKEVAFRDRLNRRLSDDPSLGDTLMSASGESAGDVRVALDRSLKEVLLDPQCSMIVLQAVKDHSKRVSAMVTSGSETLVATTIYYAAIAAALVHHDKRISRYSCESLVQRFSLLAQRAWIDGDVRGLFAQAAECCREREKGAGRP